MADAIVTSMLFLQDWHHLHFKIQTASMAAHHGRGGNDAIPICFFKTILKTNLERLKIPNKFTRKYGGGLPNPVFMKPPDGTEWKVHWTKQNCEVWFEKGWKEFVEHYSLDHGHVVFFKFKGTSQIDVLILDQTALEIDYPSCDKCDEKDNLDMSDDESVTILDEWPNQKAKQMKGMKFLNFQDAPQNASVTFKNSTDETPTQRTSSLNWPKQTRAQEVARNFISYNPFFTVFIKPNHVTEGRMIIPDLKGIIENKEKYAMLQIGEKSWNVKLFPVCERHTYCRFSAGWSVFTSENELQPGDICVFELINRQDLVFKVHVFKRQD